MGLRGPTPKPTRLKILHGSKRKDAHPTGEPQPRQLARVPKCPAWITQADARGCWRTLAAELIRLQILTVVDLASFAILCVTYGRAREADALLTASGPTFTARNGFIGQHPAVSISRNAWADVRRWAGEFGLTPAARTRLHIAGPQTDTAVDEAFLFKSPAHSNIG